MEITDIKVIGTRGVNAGKVFTPHKTKAGTYIVTKTRFQKDYLYVQTADEIVESVKAGLGVRMSAAGGPASLFSADRIKKENPAIFG